MASFVFLTSTRYITTKLIDEAEVKNAQGEVVDYRHPVLQAIGGYFGEFIISAGMCLFFWRYDPVQLKSSDKVSFFVLSLPALCDFSENMCLIFGITQIFPSLVTMSRALVLPITAIFSRCLIRKLFNINMIAALLLLLAGMTLATFVQYEGEMTSD